MSEEYGLKHEGDRCYSLVKSSQSSTLPRAADPLFTLAEGALSAQSDFFHLESVFSSLKANDRTAHVLDTRYSKRMPIVQVRENANSHTSGRMYNTRVGHLHGGREVFERMRGLGLREYTVNLDDSDKTSVHFATAKYFFRKKVSVNHPTSSRGTETTLVLLVYCRRELNMEKVLDKALAELSASGCGCVPLEIPPPASVCPFVSIRGPENAPARAQDAVAVLHSIEHFEKTTGRALKLPCVLENLQTRFPAFYLQKEAKEKPTSRILSYKEIYTDTPRYVSVVQVGPKDAMVSERIYTEDAVTTILNPTDELSERNEIRQPSTHIPLGLKGVGLYLNQSERTLPTQGESFETGFSDRPKRVPEKRATKKRREESKRDIADTGVAGIVHSHVARPAPSGSSKIDPDSLTHFPALSNEARLREKEPFSEPLPELIPFQETSSASFATRVNEAVKRPVRLMPSSSSTEANTRLNLLKVRAAATTGQAAGRVSLGDFGTVSQVPQSERKRIQQAEFAKKKREKAQKEEEFKNRVEQAKKKMVEIGMVKDKPVCRR